MHLALPSTAPIGWIGWGGFCHHFLLLYLILDYFLPFYFCRISGQLTYKWHRCYHIQGYTQSTNIFRTYEDTHNFFAYIVHCCTSGDRCCNVLLSWTSTRSCTLLRRSHTKAGTAEKLGFDTYYLKNQIFEVTAPRTGLFWSEWSGSLTLKFAYVAIYSLK